MFSLPSPSSMLKLPRLFVKKKKSFWTMILSSILVLFYFSTFEKCSHCKPVFLLKRKVVDEESVKAGDTVGDFIRWSRRIWSPAKIASYFRNRLTRTHLAIFFAVRGDVALLFPVSILSLLSTILKSNLINYLILINWRLAAMSVENRGNGQI